MTWAAGTQCVAKGDHRKPKPGELAYHKGDILTIVDTSTVLSCFTEASLHKLQKKKYDCESSFAEEGILQGQTQHNRRGRTPKLHQRS